MFYIVQENLFSERNYDKIYDVLNRLDLDHEIVKIIPFTDDIEFKTDRKDIFIFGGTKMARIAKNYNWSPGSLLNENHDYEVYSKYYKENLLNYDSTICRISDDFDWSNELYFIRPTLDNKLFTGSVFEKEDWITFRNRLINNHSCSDQLIQVAKPKLIQKEFRFFIVGGEIITGSQYTINGKYFTSPIIDEPAFEFVKEMIKIFPIASSFVIDIAQTLNGYKIVEFGCINCAGFYDVDVMKLIIAIDEYYS